MFVTFFAHGTDITLNVNSDNLKICLDLLGQEFDYSGVIPVTQLRKTLVHLYMYNPLYDMEDEDEVLEKVFFYYNELERILSHCIANDTYLIWG